MTESGFTTLVFIPMEILFTIIFPLIVVDLERFVRSDPELFVRSDQEYRNRSGTKILCNF
jgi:hypothetical protein